MSHVDDGELTAYADGAYPVNDPDALRISAHLSTCENCRTRLEQAHVLRDRAAEILAYATPSPVVAPPFESLQAQLATSPARPRRHLNLAWAATIIMALGLGWFGRGAWQNPPTRSDVAMQAPAAATDVRSEEVATPPPSVAAAPQIAAEPGASARVTATDRERARGLRPQGAGQRAGIGSTAGAATITAAPPPPSAPAVAEADFAADAAANRQYLSAAEAERRGINVPRIPELPVARIAMTQDTTFVEQSLPDGRMVRLTVTTEPQVAVRREQRSAAREAAPEMAQVQKAVVAAPVSIRQNGKLITITGELPADSLRALAQKIK